MAFPGSPESARFSSHNVSTLIIIPLEIISSTNVHAYVWPTTLKPVTLAELYAFLTMALMVAVVMHVRPAVGRLSVEFSFDDGMFTSTVTSKK